MNWLAHVFLSENHIEHQLGNLLADPLKGRAWDGATDMFIKGLQTHLHIDTFTDSHSLVKQSKRRLKDKRHLKGVVIDIVYDHLLTKHWEKFSSRDFKVFTADFRSQAPNQIEGYPDKAKTVINRVAKIKLLSSYSDLEGLGEGFKRIDKRLSQRVLTKETTFSDFALVAYKMYNLEQDFLEFFPKLIGHIQKNLDNEYLTH